MVEQTDPKLKLLTSLSQAFEAEHLKHLLAAEGISAVLDGIHASTNFGFNALMGSIQVRVPADQLQQAQAILDELGKQLHAAWKCAQCHEENEGSFDYCWKCGNERSDLASDEPAAAVSPEPIGNESATNEPDSSDFQSRHSAQAEYRPNPYATPQAELTGESFERRNFYLLANQYTSQSELEEVEDKIARGYRASILGLILLPPLMHTYSLFLLLAAAGQLHAVSSSAKRQWVLGIVVSCLAVLIAGGFWAMLLWRR